MSIVTGINGAVDGVNTTSRWSVNASADLPAVIASNTKSGRLHLAGNKDWAGSYNAFGHTPVKMPGDSFTFTGKMDTKTGPTVIGVEGVALVDQVVIVIDLEAGLPIAHEVTFSADGVLSYADDLTDFSDTTIPDPPSSIGTKLELAEAIATPVFAEIIDFRTATLTLVRENPSYVSAATGGQTRRKMGNFNCLLTYAIYEGDSTKLITPNAIKHVRLFINPTEFWELKWMRFGDISDVEVNNETGDIIGMSMNAVMHGYAQIPAGSAVVEGFVKNPAAAAVWPVA